LGGTVTLFSPGGLQIKQGGTEQTATIKGISGAFLTTDKRVTQPGDAGAPVVDTQGALIAMGYQGTGEASQLLTIDWVFQRKKLELKK
jgi:hypothetical protein